MSLSLVGTSYAMAQEDTLGPEDCATANTTTPMTQEEWNRLCNPAAPGFDPAQGENDNPDDVVDEPVVGDDREATCSSENPPPVEECFGSGSDQNNNGIADVNEDAAASTDENFEQVPNTSAGVDTGGR